MSFEVDESGQIIRSNRPQRKWKSPNFNWLWIIGIIIGAFILIPIINNNIKDAKAKKQIEIQKIEEERKIELQKVKERKEEERILTIQKNNNQLIIDARKSFDDKNFTNSKELLNDVIILEFQENLDYYYSLKGATYAKLGEHEVAIGYFTNSLSINSSDYTVLVWRAASYEKTYKYSDAIDDYTKAIWHTSDNKSKANYFYKRGNCYINISKTSNAKQDYKDALRLDPNNRTYQNKVKSYNQPPTRTTTRTRTPARTPTRTRTTTGEVITKRVKVIVNRVKIYSYPQRRNRYKTGERRLYGTLLTVYKDYYNSFYKLRYYDNDAREWKIGYILKSKVRLIE